MDFVEGLLSEVSCACVAGSKYLIEVAGVVGKFGATATQRLK